METKGKDASTLDLLFRATNTSVNLTLDFYTDKKGKLKFYVQIYDIEVG